MVARAIKFVHHQEMVGRVAFPLGKVGARTISSFDTTVDLIGSKEGYGKGEYRLSLAEDAMVFGDDFRAILRYFRERRPDGGINRKSDVSPLALKEYLPWVSLLEPVWRDDGMIENALVTLHGSSVAAAYSDNTGKYVKDIHQPHVVERIFASMQLAAKHRKPVIGQSEEREVEPPHVRLTILYLPLSSDGEAITHFFAYARLEKID